MPVLHIMIGLVGYTKLKHVAVNLYGVMTPIVGAVFVSFKRVGWVLFKFLRARFLAICLLIMQE